jgi:hypothetical protein
LSSWVSPSKTLAVSHFRRLVGALILLFVGLYGRERRVRDRV